MKSSIIIIVTAVFALILVFAADSVLQPVPVPAAIMVLGGLIGLWVRGKDNYKGIIIGLVCGLLIGVGHHLYIHMTRQSPSPQEGLLAHLIFNGAIGLIVAVLTMLVVVAVHKFLMENQQIKNWTAGHN